jgi:hypothetical protein
MSRDRPVVGALRGEFVIAFIEKRSSGAADAHVHPRRWQLTLGLDDRGERVTLPRFAAERRGVRRQRGRQVLSGRADLRAARPPRRAE